MYKDFFLFSKVDFFWINRDQRSFEWFVSLLDQMEQEQEEAGCGVGGGGSSEDQGPPCQGQKSKEKFLDFHLYFTSALQVCRFLNNIFFFIFLFRVSNPTEDGHESGRTSAGHGPHSQKGKMLFFV